MIGDHDILYIQDDKSSQKKGKGRGRGEEK